MAINAWMYVAMYAYIVYLIVVTRTRVFCLICTPEFPKGCTSGQYHDIAPWPVNIYHIPGQHHDVALAQRGTCDLLPRGSPL